MSLNHAFSKTWRLSQISLCFGKRVFQHWLPYITYLLQYLNGKCRSCPKFQTVSHVMSSILFWTLLLSSSKKQSPSSFEDADTAQNSLGDRIRELLRNLRYFRVFIALWNIAVIACMFLYVIQLSDRPFWLRVQHTVWNHLESSVPLHDFK